jgi:multicomponent Na+:H+ antiporter subunit D
MSDSNLPLLIPFTFLVAALLIPLAGSVRRWVSQPLAVAACLFSLACSVAGMARVFDSGTFRHYMAGWQPPIGIEFVLDPLAAFFLVLITSVGSLVLTYSGPIAAKEIMGKRIGFYSLAMLLMAGLTGMVVTGDLFNLYVFLEISALASYALVAIGDRRAPLSAFRYLTLGTIGASFYLTGLAFVYMSTGSLNMADVAQLLLAVEKTPPVVVGFCLMVLGMGLKMALFPMHTWLADAYTHASSAATALIAPLGTKVAAYVLIRLLFFVADPNLMRVETPLTTVIGLLGAAGLIWGSVLAVCQKELKRMLACSSIAQVGYIALGIGLSSPLGFIGAVLHALNHACMKACLFCISGNMRLRLGHSNIPRFMDTLRASMPVSAACFALSAMSMIGLPPTAGFFSKWYLIMGSLEQANWFFVLVLVLSSLLNAVYFFRVLERIYLKPQSVPAGPIEGEAEEQEPVGQGEAPLAMILPTLVLAVALLVLGVGNAWIVSRLILPMIPAGL